MTLVEAAIRSLARLRALAHDPRTNLAIMTAFRGEYDLRTNLLRNRALAYDLRSAGLGFVPVVGGFRERAHDVSGQETGEVAPVEEESYFVVDLTGAADAFQSAILRLVRKYQQEGAVLKLAGKSAADLLTVEGDKERLGEWSLNRAADYYTRLRKGPPGRSFVFEAAGDSSLITQRLVERTLL